MGSARFKMILRWPRERIGRRQNGAHWLWILRARTARTARGTLPRSLGMPRIRTLTVSFSHLGAQPPASKEYGPPRPADLFAPDRLSCRDEIAVPEPAVSLNPSGVVGALVADRQNADLFRGQPRGEQQSARSTPRRIVPWIKRVGGSSLAGGACCQHRCTKDQIVREGCINLNGAS